MHSVRRAVMRSAASASRLSSVSSSCSSSSSAQQSLLKTATSQAFRNSSSGRRSGAGALYADASLSTPSRRCFSQVPARFNSDKAALEAESAESAEAAESRAVDGKEQAAEEVASEEDAGASQGVAAVAASSEGETEHGIFVFNIVFDVTDQHLQEAFEAYGTVTKATIAREPRGLSRGYGFVWYETSEGKARAIEEANGSFWHGRRLRVAERQGRKRESKEFKNAADNPPSSSLFIGNLPYETSDADLNRLFRHLEGIRAVRVAIDRATGWPRGFAHADFYTVEAAIAAKEQLQGVKAGARELRVNYSSQSPDYKRQGRGAANKKPKNGDYDLFNNSENSE